jgi:CheY-like chemotaxis protein
MRIAYVEDNPTNLALVERVASMNQHTIVSYTEGEIALKELKTEKFDLILMDVELAGELSGLQVVRALRVGGLRTPVVAVTAYAMMGDRDKCLEAGCNDYLPKPLPIRELIDLLARYEATIKAGDAIPVPMPVEHSAVTTFSPLDRGAPDKAVEYPAPVAEAVGVAESTTAAASATAPATTPTAAPSVVSATPTPAAEPKVEVEVKPADSSAPASTPVVSATPTPAAEPKVEVEVKSVDSSAPASAPVVSTPAPAPVSAEPVVAPIPTSTAPAAPAPAPTVETVPTTTTESAAPIEKTTPPVADQTTESTKPNDTKPS